jgi:multicomponent Na+:H+ antiporter subunit G
MNVQEWLVVGLSLLGTLFMLVAAVGLNRMPDLFTRMHGAAKSTTLGITFIMLGAAVHFGTSAAAMRAALVILFFFLTAPVGTHALARAAYFRNVPRWSGTLTDELAGHYDLDTHTLE